MILTITENKSVLNVVNEKEAMNLVASKVYFKSHKASNLDADKKAHSLSKPVLKAAVKHYTKPNNMNDVPLVLIYILCFFIPPIAVGLITDWDATPVISNILWTLLCGIPGIIHALIVVGRES
ncbi:MAG: YqaE/Pmp3 family membrane protein [bacterium]|nr:YqaE/Pmp3 family membrane protein [bacterium]